MTRARDRFEKAPARAYTHAEMDQCIGEIRGLGRVDALLGRQWEYERYARTHSPLGVLPIEPAQMTLLRRYMKEKIRLTLVPDEQQEAAKAEPIGERPRPLERKTGQPPAQGQVTPTPGDTSMTEPEAA